MPSISKGTISVPDSRVRMQRIECSGRTQRSGPAPQRIDFGQGKSRTVASTVSATISAAGRPGRVVTAKKTRAFLSSRSSSWSRVRPVERRKPSMRGGGGVGARALALLADRERGVGEALDGEGQAARRGEGGGVGVGQAAGDEAVGDEARRSSAAFGPASGPGFPRRRARAGGPASVSPGFRVRGVPASALQKKRAGCAVPPGPRARAAAACPLGGRLRGPRGRAAALSRADAGAGQRRRDVPVIARPRGRGSPGSPGRWRGRRRRRRPAAAR